MDRTALLLILASTVGHGAWNALARGAGEAAPVLFRRMLAVLAAGWGLPVVLADLFADPVLPWSLWPWMLASGLGSAVYILGLAEAYRRQDLSFAYPVARALPILLLGLLDLLLGRPPGLAGGLGLLAVALGCLLAPGQGWRLPAGGPAEFRGVFLAALGAVIYTRCDKVLVDALPPGGGPAARYAGIYFLACWLFLEPAWRLRFRGLRPAPPPAWGRVLAAASLNLLSYALVLAAYQRVTAVSLAFAFRQASIPLVLLWSALVLREPVRGPRLVAQGLILLGLILIAL